MTFFDRIQELAISQLAIDPARIPVVILSGVCIYLGFLLLVRVFGVRVLAKMTTFDAVVIVMFGAVAGRVVIGHPPTLVAGIIGLLTLMAMEALFGMVRDLRGIKATLVGRPQVLVAHGEIIAEQLKKTHVRKADVKHAVRPLPGLFHFLRRRPAALRPPLPPHRFGPAAPAPSPGR